MNLKEKLIEKIQEHPLAAVAITVVTGCVAGHFVGIATAKGIVLATRKYHAS